MEETTTHHVLTLVATAALSAAVAASGAILLSWRDLGIFESRLDVLNSDVESIKRQLRTVDLTDAAIAKQVAENSIHRIEHEKSAERWIDQIIENENDIHDLQSRTSARPDPFTGTQGRELRKRIEKLEENKP